jgi:hypothetical protein
VTIRPRPTTSGLSFITGATIADSQGGSVSQAYYGKMKDGSY